MQHHSVIVHYTLMYLNAFNVLTLYNTRFNCALNPHAHSRVPILCATAHARYWFITNGLLSIQTISPHYIKKKSKNFSWFDSPPSVTLFLRVSWQLVTPHCQKIGELDNFTLYISWTLLLPDTIYSPPTSSWTWLHPYTIWFVVWITEVILPPNFWHFFKLPVLNISSST